MSKMLHMNKINLTELLIKAQDGDKTSYGLFLKECSIYLKYRLKKWNSRPEVVEEITQEVLIGIHRNLQTFLPGRNAEAWIMGIAKFKVIDFLRKNPHKFQELNFDVTSDENETNYDMEDIFSDLPEMIQEALLMTKIQGLSTKEAALKLGIKENALRTRLSRALSRFRKDSKH